MRNTVDAALGEDKQEQRERGLVVTVEMTASELESACASVSAAVAAAAATPWKRCRPNMMSIAQQMLRGGEVDVKIN